MKMYKRKSRLVKSYTADSFKTLPLSEFSNVVFGERAADFDGILRHPQKEDAFWSTRFGGGETRGALDHVRFPVLLVTGFYDIYTGGIFDMWHAMDDEARALCALAVHPFDHSGRAAGQPIAFENGEMETAFGPYAIKWLNAVRGKEAYPFARGKVTYYPLFGGKWCCDDFYPSNGMRKMGLGTGSVTYVYNPYA